MGGFNKSQDRALEFILLWGAKTHGCSSTWAGIKFKWWYKVYRLPDNMYPKLLSKEWEIKTHRDRQRVGS